MIEVNRALEIDQVFYELRKDLMNFLERPNSLPSFIATFVLARTIARVIAPRVLDCTRAPSEVQFFDNKKLQ